MTQRRRGGAGLEYDEDDQPVEEPYLPVGSGLAERKGPAGTAYVDMRGCGRGVSAALPRPSTCARPAAATSQKHLDLHDTVLDIFAGKQPGARPPVRQPLALAGPPC